MFHTFRGLEHQVEKENEVCSFPSQWNLVILARNCLASTLDCIVMQMRKTKALVKRRVIVDDSWFSPSYRQLSFK